ncbi:MAG: carboxymuconolactone decarboxylase family protein [Spirochaetes bacterium]|nr:MAG: carboxymuconolactone decarboxylase family protein [Spirochaetota bacterium]
MERKFDKRIHDLKTQNEDIKKLLAHSDSFVKTMVNPVISKTFSESISLAVTQVNGCKLCSYTHAKNALKAGMTEAEVEFLLSGGFDNAPKDQLEGLLFAQHYADTKGNPDPEAVQKLVDIYGDEKTKDIMSHILIIMLSNLHGNTMEAFKLRLKGKGVEGSSFWQELAVIVNFFKIMPVILFKMLGYKLFTTKKTRSNRMIHQPETV